MSSQAKIILYNKENGTKTEIIDPDITKDKSFYINSNSGNIVSTKDKFEIFVGPDEKVKTIKEALEIFSTYYPIKMFKDSIGTGTADSRDNNFYIILKDNYVLNEQIIIYSRDLSHITLTTETPGRIVEADPRILKTNGGGYGQYGYRQHRAFFYFRYSKSFKIGIRFKPNISWDLEQYNNPSGIGNGSQVDYFFGFHFDNASTGCLLPNAGVDNIYWGLFASNASVVSATNSFYDKCSVSVCSDNSSLINIQYSNIKNSLSNSVWAAEAGMIDAEGTVIENSKHAGFVTTQNGRINCGSITVKNFPSTSSVLAPWSGSLTAYNMNYNKGNNKGRVIVSSLESSLLTTERRVHYTVI